jgi:hypothetical protein
MGLKDFFNKISSKNSIFDYVVDKDTFKTFVEKTIEFAREHELEIIDEFYIYINGEKQLVQIWNLDADQFKATKGISIKYNGMEYTNFEGFYEKVIQPIPAEYIHIYLTLRTDDFLDEYKKNHPELKPQDF